LDRFFRGLSGHSGHTLDPEINPSSTATPWTAALLVRAVPSSTELLQLTVALCILLPLAILLTLLGSGAIRPRPRLTTPAPTQPKRSRKVGSLLVEAMVGGLDRELSATVLTFPDYVFCDNHLAAGRAYLQQGFWALRCGAQGQSAAKCGTASSGRIFYSEPGADQTWLLHWGRGEVWFVSLDRNDAQVETLFKPHYQTVNSLIHRTPPPSGRAHDV